MAGTLSDYSSIRPDTSYNVVGLQSCVKFPNTVVGDNVSHALSS